MKLDAEFTEMQQVYRLFLKTGGAIREAAQISCTVTLLDAAGDADVIT